MKRWCWMLSVALAVGQIAWAADQGYEARLRLQLEKTAVTTEQYDAFRAVLRDYHEARNGATRRVSRQGGDIPTRVGRDLRRLASRTLKDMEDILDPEQLAHMEKYLELANEQYMVQAGLR